MNYAQGFRDGFMNAKDEITEYFEGEIDRVADTEPLLVSTYEIALDLVQTFFENRLDKME